MALTKLGNYIEQTDNRNIDFKFTENDVRGISTSKQFIYTKADLEGVNLSNYKVINKDEFVYVPDTSRRGEKIGLAYCDKKPCIVSSIYSSFKVKEKAPLLPRFLMMYFNRAEFDRYARFNSWGSARETFTWDDMCDIEINLPSLDIQKKYVAIYESLLLNLKSYESKLEDLKLVCDGYIEDLRKKYVLDSLGKFIHRIFTKNIDFKIEKLIGVGMNGIIPPAQSKDETNGHICYLVNKGNFLFAPPQIHKGAIDIYREDQTVKCSDAYIVFDIISPLLNKDFLLLILKSPFFQKYSEYYRDGVREQFDFDQLCEYRVPIPPIEIQKSIVNVFDVYNKRKDIVNKLKEKISTICPILIRGAIKEESIT